MVSVLPGRPPLRIARPQRVGQSVTQCSAQQPRKVCEVHATLPTELSRLKHLSFQVKAKAVEAPIRGQQVEEPTDQSAANAVRTNLSVQDPAAYTKDIIEREKK